MEEKKVNVNNTATKKEAAVVALSSLLSKIKNARNMGHSDFVYDEEKATVFSFFNEWIVEKNKFLGALAAVIWGVIFYIFLAYFKIHFVLKTNFGLNYPEIAAYIDQIAKVGIFILFAFVYKIIFENERKKETFLAEISPSGLDLQEKKWLMRALFKCDVEKLEVKKMIVFAAAAWLLPIVQIYRIINASDFVVQAHLMRSHQVPAYFLAAVILAIFILKRVFECKMETKNEK